MLVLGIIIAYLFAWCLLVAAKSEEGDKDATSSETQ